MLTQEQITNNKAKFLQLVASIERDHSREQLLSQLTGSDFFTAPASTQYHCSYAGGLCEHSLNVYNNLLSLVQQKGLEKLFSDDTLKIVSLFHDFSKMSYYEPNVINKKVYSESGSKRDELGFYDWKSIQGYKTREAKNRFVFGNHEQTAERMISTFIPLTTEESVAILHHHGGAGWDCTQTDITTIFNTYPLATLLHLADMEATFIDERIDE